jgi:hypothetical protein
MNPRHDRREFGHRVLHVSDFGRPYIATGVYTQWVRARRQDVVAHLVSRLSRTLASYQKLLAAETQKDTTDTRGSKRQSPITSKSLPTFGISTPGILHDEFRARLDRAARSAEPEVVDGFPARRQTRGRVARLRE